jgi:hypothetical protein
MKNITLITAKNGLSFELVPKPVRSADLGPQIVVHDGDFLIASYCLSTFRENVAKKQGVCVTAGKFEKYRAIESDTLAELVAEADALLSGTLPPPASQGTHTPELLAALNIIAAGSVQDTGENGMGTVNIDRETMQLIARAAIAKATGGAK